MNKPDLFPSRWCWRGVAVCNLLAAVLLASWLWQPTRQLWDALDIRLFHLLNAPLSASPIWAHLWAIGSMRPVDAGVGLLMVAILAKDNWVYSGPQVRQAFYAFLALLLVLLLIRVGLFVELVRLMKWTHASPSLAVDGAVRLTEMFPDWQERWDMKDSAGQSFPGDHASVVLLWVMLLSVHTRGWKLFTVWVLAVVFMLPRLVSGAHWVSDALVGGAFLSLVTFGWGYFTPFTAKASELLERLGAPVMRVLGRIPGLRRIALISGR
ncbi:MAG TPA: phosphatase PAP2 family protein [Methylophilaceae bacterium]|nr:phosphatase PAP2 family protein [Methylophilaceae bacterium]